MVESIKLVRRNYFDLLAGEAGVWIGDRYYRVLAPWFRSLQRLMREPPRAYEVIGTFWGFRVRRRKEPFRPTPKGDTDHER